MFRPVVLFAVIGACAASAQPQNRSVPAVPKVIVHKTYRCGDRGGTGVPLLKMGKQL